MDGAEIFGTLMTPAGRANPYPVYEAAHKLGSVIPAGGGYLVVGYPDVNQLLRDNAFGVADDETRSTWDPAWRDVPSVVSMAASILHSNAPDHGRMRSLISSVFTPRRVHALEPTIAAATDRLLDGLADRGAAGTAVDFMAEFSYQLPVSVICELIGVPEAERDRFRILATDLAAVLDFVSEMSALEAADVAAVELKELFTALVAERRAAPRDDLASALVAVCDADDGTLSEVELLANLTLLLIAGFETTANLFGNGLVQLFEHPDVAAALRAGEIGYQGFIDEVLRYDSPVQMTSRTAMADDATIGGVRVERGMEVAVLIGAANRDPHRYSDAGRFDPTRTDINPLSFGAGVHFCVGSVLARLEAATAFPRLVSRFPALASGGEPIRNSRLLLRGYEHLPVTVS